MKKYINCNVTNVNGTVFQNPLKLSEAHLILQIAKENKSILITIVECSKEQYKQIFG